MFLEEVVDSQSPFLLLPVVLLTAIVPQGLGSEFGLIRLFVKGTLVTLVHPVLPALEGGRSYDGNGEIGRGARVGEELRGEFLMVDSYFIEKLLICKGEQSDAHGKSVVRLLPQLSQHKLVLHCATTISL